MMELRVCHLYPDVLNLYGDRGNVLCIKKRLEWRGIGCTVTELPIGERRPLGGFDLFFVGGGQDFEQGLLLEDLRGGKGADIRAAAEDGAAFLCVCGGYQLMGHYYDTATGVRCAGLDVLDLATEGAEERMIGNFAFETEFGPVVGFENHSGRTRLQAFGAGAASGLVEPLGALAAFALAGWVQAALPWLMSAAAGCMVCVTAQEMIPEAVEQDEPAGVVSIVLGFALMMALDVAL